MKTVAHTGHITSSSITPKRNGDCARCGNRQMGDQAARKAAYRSRRYCPFGKYARDCDKLSQTVLMTRAELMRHALSQALRRVHIGPKKLKLDEETRWQIAGEAVEELRRYGGWKELDEEAPMRPLAKG